MRLTSSVIIRSKRNLCFHLAKLQKRLFPDFYVTESTESKLLEAGYFQLFTLPRRLLPNYNATEPSASKLYATEPAASKFSRCRADCFQVVSYRTDCSPVVSYRADSFPVFALQSRMFPNNMLRNWFLPNCHATEPIASKSLRYKTDCLQNVLLPEIISCKYVTDIYTRHLRHQCKELVVETKTPGSIVAIYPIPVSICRVLIRAHSTTATDNSIATPATTVVCMSCFCFYCAISCRTALV